MDFQSSFLLTNKAKAVPKSHKLSNTYHNGLILKKYLFFLTWKMANNEQTILAEIFGTNGMETIRYKYNILIIHQI